MSSWICIYSVLARQMGGRVYVSGVDVGCFSTSYRDCEALEEREDQLDSTLLCVFTFCALIVDKNMDYALRLAIRRVLSGNSEHYMSAAEIRTFLHGLTPTQDFTEQQIALSIMQ